jgi:DNA-binding ferritin-like protein
MSKLSALQRQLDASQANLSQALAELADLKEIHATMLSVVRMVRPYMREDETILTAIQRIIAIAEGQKEGAR